MRFFYDKKAIINYLVWIISLAPAYILKYSTAKEAIDKEYTIYEGILYLILGVGLTFGIQMLIDKYDRPKEPIFRKFIRIAGYFLVALILYNLIMYPFAIYVSAWMSQEPVSPSKYGFIGTNVVNIFIWITWYIVYVLFQLLDKLQQSRVHSAELASNLRESQLNALKGQINPHFIFNSLNNIRGLMLEDVERSRDSLTRLSEMLRYSLVKSTNDSISLEEEMEMVQNFVEISKIQFEDRLSYEENIDPTYLSKPIPPMIIQLLVENATKHGIAKLKNGGLVHVFAGMEADNFVIRVINTGQLAYAQNSTKLGLQNIEKRLDLLYGNKASFSLEEREGKVIAEIKMP